MANISGQQKVEGLASSNDQLGDRVSRLWLQLMNFLLRLRQMQSLAFSVVAGLCA